MSEDLVAVILSQISVALSICQLEIGITLHVLVLSAVNRQSPLQHELRIARHTGLMLAIIGDHVSVTVHRMFARDPKVKVIVFTGSETLVETSDFPKRFPSVRDGGVHTEVRDGQKGNRV